MVQFQIEGVMVAGVCGCSVLVKVELYRPHFCAILAQEQGILDGDILHGSFVIFVVSMSQVSIPFYWML